MARPKLRICVEHILCRTPLYGPGAPSLRHQPPTGDLVDFLLRATAWGEVTLCPLEPGPGRAATIQYWLFLVVSNYFRLADHPSPEQATDDLVGSIAVTDLRKPCDISMEMDSLWCPEGAPWPTMRELNEAVARVGRLRVAAE
jgi:hypothetical protein